MTDDADAIRGAPNVDENADTGRVAQPRSMVPLVFQDGRCCLGVPTLAA